MRPKSLTFSILTPSVNGIALAQTPGAAGNLLLNGALANAAGTLVDFNPAVQATGKRPTGLAAYLIDFTSAGNDANRNLTITGTDPDGQAQTETLVGPNANTVTSTKYFKTITSIAIDGVAAAALSSGIKAAGAFVSQTYCLDQARDTSFAVDIGGTINYDVQKCFERPTAQAVNDPGNVPNWLAGGLTGQVIDASSNYQQATGAIRLKVNSYTAGGGLAAALRIMGAYNSI